MLSKIPLRIVSKYWPIGPFVILIMLPIRNCTVVLVIALAFNIYLASGLFEYICTEKGLYKPYIRVYKSRKGAKLYSAGPGFYDLQNRNNLYICVNGPAFYYFSLNKTNGEVFTKPEFNVTSHVCATYNRSPKPGHTHANSVRKLLAILLMGDPEDYRKPSIQLLPAPMWNYNTRTVENGTSIVLFGNEDCILSKMGQNITIRPPKPKVPGAPEFCMRAFGESLTRPEEEVVLRADSSISVIGCSPEIAFRSASPATPSPAKSSGIVQPAAPESNPATVPTGALIANVSKVLKDNTTKTQAGSPSESDKGGPPSTDEILEGRSDSFESTFDGENETLAHAPLSNSKLPSLPLETFVIPAVENKSTVKSTTKTSMIGKPEPFKIIDDEVLSGRAGSLEDTPDPSNKPSMDPNNDLRRGHNKLWDFSKTTPTPNMSENFYPEENHKLGLAGELGETSHSEYSGSIVASNTSMVSDSMDDTLVAVTSHPHRKQQNVSTGTTQKSHESLVKQTEAPSTGGVIEPGPIIDNSMTDQPNTLTSSQPNLVSTSIPPRQKIQASTIKTKIANIIQEFAPSLVKQTEAPSAGAVTEPGTTIHNSTTDLSNIDTSSQPNIEPTSLPPRQKIQASTRKTENASIIQEFAPSLVKRTEASSVVAVTEPGTTIYKSTTDQSNIGTSSQPNIEPTSPPPRQKIQASTRKTEKASIIQEFSPSLVKRTEASSVVAVTESGTTIVKSTTDQSNTVASSQPNIVPTSPPPRQKIQASTRKTANASKIQEFAPSLVKQTEAPSLGAVTELGPSISKYTTEEANTNSQPEAVTTSVPPRKKVQASTRKPASVTNINEFAPSLVKLTEVPSMGEVTEQDPGIYKFTTEQMSTVTSTQPNVVTSPPARQKVQPSTRKTASSTSIKEFAPSMVKETVAPPGMVSKAPTPVELDGDNSTIQLSTASTPPSDVAGATSTPTPPKKIQAATKKAASKADTKEYAPSLVKRTEAPSVEAVTEPSAVIDMPMTQPSNIVTTAPPDMVTTTTSRPERQKPQQAATRKSGSSSIIKEFAPSLVKRTEATNLVVTTEQTTLSETYSDNLVAPQTTEDTSNATIPYSTKKIQAASKKAANSADVKEFAPSLVKRTETPSLEAVTEPFPGIEMPMSKLPNFVTTVPPDMVTTSRPERQKPQQAATKKAGSSSIINEFAPSLVKRTETTNLVVTTDPTTSSETNIDNLVVPQTTAAIPKSTVTNLPSQELIQSLVKRTEAPPSVTEFPVDSPTLDQPITSETTTAMPRNKVQAPTKKAGNIVVTKEFAPSLVKQTEAPSAVTELPVDNPTADQPITQETTTVTPRNKVQVPTRKAGNIAVIKEFAPSLVKRTESPPAVTELPVDSPTVDQPITSETTTVTPRNKVQAPTKKAGSIAVTKEFVPSFVRNGDMPPAVTTSVISTSPFGTVTPTEIPVTTSAFQQIATTRPPRIRVQASTKKYNATALVKEFVPSLVKNGDSFEPTRVVTQPSVSDAVVDTPSAYNDISTAAPILVTSAQPSRNKVQAPSRKAANSPDIKEYAPSLVKRTETPFVTINDDANIPTSHPVSSVVTTLEPSVVTISAPARKKVQSSNQKAENAARINNFVPSLVKRTDDLSPADVTEHTPAGKNNEIDLSVITSPPTRTKLQPSSKKSNHSVVVIDFVPSLIKDTDSPSTSLEGPIVDTIDNDAVPEESQIPAQAAAAEVTRSSRNVIQSAIKKVSKIIVADDFAPDLDGNRIKRQTAQKQPPPARQSALPTLIEITECEPLPILQVECDAGKPNKEHACKLFSGMLGTQEPIWPPQTEWRQIILNLVVDIFGRSCTRVPRAFAIKIANIMKFYLTDALTGKTVDPERDTWRFIINELNKCKKQGARILFKFQSNNEDSKSAFLKSGIKIQAGVKITEDAENEYAFNWALDMNWKMFSTVLAMCLPMSDPNKASLSSRFYTMYIQDFLNPIVNTWTEYKDNLIFQFILGEYYHGDTESWVNNCVEASYLLSNWGPFRPVRPMLENDMLGANYLVEYVWSTS